jgi:uncharacterized metal-binding protein
MVTERLMCALCKRQDCLNPPEEQELAAYCPGLRESPGYTTALDEARALYDEPPVREIAQAAARVEADGYRVWPRVREVMEFADRLEAEHIGVATCVGLIQESRMLQEILEANGYQVSSVCCKVGSIDKLDLGLRQEETLAPEGGFDPACNPIGQARILNAAGTELNVLVGLCVGHDTLFFKYADAPSTVLIAKDRVTGHNPAAALYTSHHYYRDLKEAER